MIYTTKPRRLEVTRSGNNLNLRDSSCPRDFVAFPDIERVKSLNSLLPRSRQLADRSCTKNCELISSNYKTKTQSIN